MTPSGKLRVVAIGDSIMWGQGNQSPFKFTDLVGAWLGERLGDPVEVIAHSGATAGATPNDARAAFWGEVPEKAPSVLAQLRSVQRPETVNVVLVNGGINDVSAINIAIANPFDPNGLAKLEALTKTVFASAVRDLLAATHAAFPNAKVVVLGYYQIISEHSRGAHLYRLMNRHRTRNALERAFDWLVEHLSAGVIDWVMREEKPRMAKQCETFARLSTEALQGHVASFGNGRMAVALPAFTPANAFAAHDTWLWCGTDDPLYNERKRRIAEEGIGWPPDTLLASMCHPNVAGAKAYAEAIIAALEQLQV